uniref:Uncharacterized protein n=1 Tax=Arundo donax TaxID=35708 RepID=A0A0A8ZTX9_ARUDO
MCIACSGIKSCQIEVGDGMALTRYCVAEHKASGLPHRQNFCYEPAPNPAHVPPRSRLRLHPRLLAAPILRPYAAMLLRHQDRSSTSAPHCISGLRGGHDLLPTVVTSWTLLPP